ncbi:YciI family protein [Amnibacterium sp.]|uniref:YciI family protein n=1 Tax=Amnibacterium sp. TaxID=1872496 RepID=UPI0026336FF2|nr:YciI family protein [Amnibacterium sp.]
MKEGAEARVMEVYPRHREYLDRVAADGRILLIGPLLPAPGSGSMAVFRDAEAAAAFPLGDPFVLEGLAEPLPVQEWNALEYL